MMDRRRIPRTARRLSAAARVAEAAIEREISDFLSDVLAGDAAFITDAMVAQSRAKVGRVIGEFGALARDWADNDLTAYYERQVAVADSEMRRAGINIETFLTTPAARDRLLNRGIKAIYTDFNTRFKDLLSIVARKTYDVYSQVQQKSAMYGFKDTDNVKLAIRHMREEFKRRGVVGFVDRSDREWHMDNYTDMLGRTITARARIAAKEMEFLAHGQNLVRISYHLPTCPLCVPWNGVIVALAEPTEKYPYTLDDAREEGLMHPNCLHVITLYAEGFSEPGPTEPDFSDEAQQRNKEERAAARELGERQRGEERQRRRERYRAGRVVANAVVIDTTNQRVFDMQFFAFDPEKIREAIRNGDYNLRVRPQKQNKHIEGTMEYERYAKELEARNQIPSILTVSAQELVDRYAGTGKIEKLSDDAITEYVKADQIVGKFWNNKLKHWTFSAWFGIKYSKKKGVHVYPVYGGDK